MITACLGIQIAWTELHFHFC